MSCENKCSCLVFDFGNFSCGECIDLPLEAVQSGVHKLIAVWRGKYYIVESTLDIGETISFRNIFNEDAKIDFKIVQPDGCLLKYTVEGCDDEDDTIYKNFRLTVSEIFTYTEELITAQEVCGSELAEDGSKIIVCKTF